MKPSLARAFGGYSVTSKRAFLLLSIYVLVVIYIAWPSTSSTLLTSCNETTCSSSGLGLSADNNEVETAQFNFKISGSVPSYSGQNLAAGKFNLFNSSGNSTIYIPMRDGSSPAFPVTIPSLHSGDIIRVKIISSQTFFVYKNDLIVYTHRYQIPVFFTDVKNPVSSFMLPEIQRSTYTIYIRKVSTFRSICVLVLLMFLAIILGSSYSLSRKKGRKIDFPSIGRFPTSIFGLMWLVSIIRWVSKQHDSTGTLKTGPFGPIGPFFSDMYQVLQSGANTKPYTYGSTDYPPLSVAIGQLTRFLPITIVVLSLLAITVLVSTIPLKEFKFGKFNWLKLKSLVVLTFSYPIIFGLLRGNYDLLAIALTLAAIYEYKKQMYLPSIIYLSFAVSLKYWPVLFVLIYLKDRRFNLVLKTLFSSMILTVTSCVVLNYYSLRDIFHVSTKSLLDYGTNSTSLSSYAFSYSINSILLVLFILIVAKRPSSPTTSELHQALDFSQGLVKYFLVLLILGTSIYLFNRFRKLSSLCLLVSSLTLILTSTSATYRGGILIACLLVRALEGDRTFLRFQGPIRQSLYSKNQIRLLRYLEAVAWLCILAPADFFYQSGTFFSTTSILQPLSTIAIVLVEYFYARIDTSSKLKGNG